MQKRNLPRVLSRRFPDAAVTIKESVVIVSTF